MHPISRAAAAIDIIDNYLEGSPIEIALKNWSRKNRFAGSNDRYLIRDIIFEILRKRRSLFVPFQVNGYRENGRLLVLSFLSEHYDKIELIDEIRKNKYFREVPNAKEVSILAVREKILKNSATPIKFDYPPFLMEEFSQSLGKNFELVMKKMQERAPLYLRVNTLKIQPNDVQKILADEGILCSALSISERALQVFQGRRKIKRSQSYASGLVEIQDASSQVMIDIPEIKGGSRILDYCAGAGGENISNCFENDEPRRIISF